jgi:hypothetical protein
VLRPRRLARLLAALLYAAPSAHAASLEPAESLLAGGSVVDLSAPGVVAFSLLLDDAPVEIAIALDPSETAAPVGLVASVATLGDVMASGARVSLIGDGVALGAVGSFARDGRGAVAAPAPTAGAVTLPLDAARPLHVLEIGATGATNAQPWTITAGGLDPPHRFRLRVELVPEPGAALATAAALGVLAALRRRRCARAAIAVAIVAATNPASAAVVSVTTAVDGASGSLRERLSNAVADGDTITFSVATVGLASALDVIHSGVTLQGPVTIQPQGAARAVVTLSAPGITVQGDVRFLDTTLSVGGAFGTTGVRVLGNRFEGDSPVFFENDGDCELRGNTFTVNTGSSSSVVNTTFTENCTLATNTFTTSLDSAISDAESEGLTIDDNTADADISVFTKSGAITNNRVPEIWVFPPGAGASEALSVAGNEVDFLFVKRANVDVVGNTVHAGEGFGRLGAAAFFVHGGPPSSGSFSARLNIVTGGETGILFADLFGPSLASELRDNEVTDAARIGITASLTAGTVVAENDVGASGTGTAGTGIEILRPRTPGVAEENAVTATGGAGIAVIEPAQAYTVRRNSITGSSAAGIEVVGGPGRVEIDGNTVAQNQGPGVAIGNGVLARISGGSYAENGDAGVLVFPTARAEITEISATGNLGPGIDLFPKGVTPNPATKDANQDLDWPEVFYDAASQRLVGIAAPLSRVEVYAVEGGPRLGNPDNGEGEIFLGSVMTDTAGQFTYPASGALLCTPELLLTLTDTVPGANAYTSEFSPDFRCDADSDGIAVPEDQCPATPEAIADQVDASGCYETRTQPDGTEVYCNTATSCSTATADGRGPCLDCAYRTALGAFWDCLGSVSCFTSFADDSRSCQDGCAIRDGSFSVACGEGGCRETDDVYRCEGDAGECSGRAGDLAFACALESTDSPALPCTIVTAPEVSQSLTSGKITITKEIRGEGDASFGIELLPGLSGAITTSGGIGTRSLQLIFPGTALPGAERTIRELVPNGWALVDVVCTSEGVRAIENGIAFDPAPNADLHCAFVNERLAGPTLPAGGVTFPDVIVRSRTFGLPPGNRIVVSGSNGLVVMDPLTGAIPQVGNTTLSFVGDFNYRNLLGSLVVESPAGDGADAIFAYRNTSGASIQSYAPEISDFGATQLVFATYRDAVHLGNDPAQTEALLAGTSFVQRFTWSDFGTPGGPLFPRTERALDNFTGAGSSVSAFGFPGLARILAVTSGTPGKLVIGDPAQPTQAVSVLGDVGDDPRRIRCLASVCAVSNFGSDSLTIATWDGATNVAITDTQAVGDGPIGIDLRALPGGDVAIASTGFGDATYSVTRVSSAGAVVASVTLPAPPGCEQPGHALWLGDDDQHLVLSCFGSDALAVFAPELPAP